MGRKPRMGLTRDLFDAEGKFVIPGPGLKLADDLDWLEYGLFDEHFPEVTSAQIEGFDMVGTLTPAWSVNSVRGNDRLLSVHRFGVGYDMIDVPALTEAGVALTLTRDAVRRPVAAAILADLLALSTRMMTKDRIAREGRWNDRVEHHGIGLVGRILGVIGVGNIGHEVFRLATPLNMKHLGCDPYITQESVDDVGVKLVDLDTILAEADFLSICCPLNDETRYMIGEAQLKKMKPTAFLINMARGPIVDEQALIRALDSGTIQGAGLDVFEQEPTSPDNPLLKMSNVIVAPHAMCWTDQLFDMQWTGILGQMDAIRRGEMPSGLLNAEVWDSPLFQKKLARLLEETR